MKLWLEKKDDPHARLAKARAKKYDPNNASNRVKAFVNTNPGYSTLGIARALDLREGTVYQILHRARKQGKIKGLTQDGKLRFYAINYITPSKQAKPEPKPAKPVNNNNLQLVSTIEGLAKDYAWETGSPTDQVKDFINYIKDKANE